MNSVFAQYEELSSPQFAVINLSLRLRLITANFGLDNSSYRAQPHSIIVNNLTCEIIHDNLTCENYRFSNIAFLYKLSLFKDCLYIINRIIHGCLEIPDLFLMLNMISHSFAALTREISCSTLEINLVFPRTHVLFSI